MRRPFRTGVTRTVGLVAKNGSKGGNNRRGAQLSNYWWPSTESSCAVALRRTRCCEPRPRSPTGFGGGKECKSFQPCLMIIGRSRSWAREQMPELSLLHS